MATGGALRYWACYCLRMPFDLRNSRQIFSDRYGIPGDLNFYAWIEEKTYSGLRFDDRVLVNWNPKGKRSNCPEIESCLDVFAKFTEWPLHKALRNVFVGLVPVIEPNAVATAFFGQDPCVAISAGLIGALEQCQFLWESMYRVIAETAVNVDRMSEAEALSFYVQRMGDKGIERQMVQTNSLRRLLTEGDPEFISRALSHPGWVEIPRSGTPKIDLNKRNRRAIASHAFVVAHELGHVLLGHVCRTKTEEYAKKQVERHQEVISRLEIQEESQLHEVEADLFGFHEILLRTFCAKALRINLVPQSERDRQFIGLLGQQLEAAAIVNLAIHMVGKLGGLSTGTGTHPAPKVRMKALCGTADVLISGVVDKTTEPDFGPHGPGYFVRARKLPDYILLIYRTVENLLNHCK